MSREERIQYLEDERVLLWGKVTELEEMLRKKTSDYENDAKLSSEKAQEYRSLSESAEKSISESLSSINVYADAIKTSYESIVANDVHLSSLSTEAVIKSGDLARIHSETINRVAEIQNKISEIEKVFENKPIIDEKLIKLEGVFTKSDDYDSKISMLFKSIQDKKKEIDQIYYEIYGYTETNDDGTESEVEGLKDQLDKSYDDVTNKLVNIENSLDQLKISTKADYDAFMKAKNQEYSDFSNNCEKEYGAVLTRIKELLPNALTTGLSYAYAEKREIEVSESKVLKVNFFIGIVGLVIVSLIPFFVSAYLIATGDSLEDSILKIPRLVLAILPLYIPVMWVAYSSNRKLNLSKRLIEEYSHKETLSKTFEGLASQINNIDDKGVSNDLRIKLLYNILEVNSENPGKLISDYNKSDHPLMDALDKSVKLTNAVTKLSKIPGFTKIASTLEKKSQKLIDIEQKKAELGLETVEE